MWKGKEYDDPTVTGLRFEKKTSLRQAFLEAGFQVDGDSVSKENKVIGEIRSGEKRLYDLLDERSGLEKGGSKKLLSKILRPDEAFLNLAEQTLYIVEKKYQESTGSVDEKPQTVRFKQRQYERLTRDSGLKFDFFYLFNCWYAQPSYSDMLEFLEEEGSSYYFNTIPFSRFGLDQKTSETDGDHCLEHDRPMEECREYWSTQIKKRRKKA